MGGVGHVTLVLRIVLPWSAIGNPKTYPRGSWEIKIISRIQSSLGSPTFSIMDLTEPQTPLHSELGSSSVSQFSSHSNSGPCSSSVLKWHDYQLMPASWVSVGKLCISCHHSNMGERDLSYWEIELAHGNHLVHSRCFSNGVCCSHGWAMSLSPSRESLTWLQVLSCQGVPPCSSLLSMLSRLPQGSSFRSPATQRCFS